MSVGVLVPIYPKEFWFSGLCPKCPFFPPREGLLSSYDYVLGLCNVNLLRKKKEQEAQKCSRLNYEGIVFLSGVDRIVIQAVTSPASMYRPHCSVS